MYGEATSGYIYDDTKVILFSKDYFNATAGELGPLTGYENIIAIGWIDGETIDWSPDHSTVTFTVRGPSFRLAQIESLPFVLNNSTAAPTDWNQFEDLTVDDALWHYSI